VRYVALILAALSGTALADGFRSAEFGMSEAQVRATESGVAWGGKGNVIGFKTEIAGLDAIAQYEFTNGKFYGGGYRVIEEHSNRTLYLSDYDELLGLLTQKYGKP